MVIDASVGWALIEKEGEGGTEGRRECDRNEREREKKKERRG